MEILEAYDLTGSDLTARPVIHHRRESLGTHLSIVFAALAGSRWVEKTTGWSNKRFVTTARRYPRVRDPGRQAHDHRR